MYTVEKAFHAVYNVHIQTIHSLLCIVAKGYFFSVVT